MAQKTDLVNFRTLNNIYDFIAVYDKETDTLILQPAEKIPAVSVDYNGEFWIRINPDNGEIVGIEIENYKSIFLKKYPHPVKKKITYDVSSIAECITNL